MSHNDLGAETPKPKSLFAEVAAHLAERELDISATNTKTAGSEKD